MLGRELLVALAQGQRLSGLNEAAGAVRIFLEVHLISLGLSPPPLRHGWSILCGLRSCRPAKPNYRAGSIGPDPNGERHAAMWEPGIRGGRGPTEFSSGDARVRARGRGRARLPARAGTCRQVAADRLTRPPPWPPKPRKSTPSTGIR